MSLEEDVDFCFAPVGSVEAHSINAAVDETSTRISL